MGRAYAVPNPEDTPYIEELARTEGILLDPVYTSKAFAAMMQMLRQASSTERTTCCSSTPAAPRPSLPWTCPGESLPARPAAGTYPLKEPFSYGIFPRTS